MLERLRRRVRRHAPEVPAVPAVPQGRVDLAAFPGIDPLLDAGDISGVMELVDSHQPGLSPYERARLELQLRNEAFTRAARGPEPDVQWPPRSDRDLGPKGALPEIAASDLDRDALVSGVRNYGAVIVRGFFPAAACADLRDMIDQAMDHYGQDSTQEHPQWNVPFRTVEGEVMGAAGFRAFNFVAAGLAVPDAPAMADYCLAEFAALGLPDLVASYLGERPAVSLEKWTMRRVPPDTGSSWHQDGAFLGTDKRTLNMWIALSDCGETSSGLDIVAHRFDHIVTTGTEGAYYDWDVSPTVMEQERGEDPVVSPVFRAGDAVFFDQFLLHKTGTKPDLTEDRYALETWFFTPTSFPGHYSGVLL